MSGKYTIAGGKVFDEQGDVVGRLHSGGKIIWFSQSVGEVGEAEPEGVSYSAGLGLTAKTGSLLSYLQGIVKSVVGITAAISPVLAEAGPGVSGAILSHGNFSTIYLRSAADNNASRIQSCIDYISSTGGGIVSLDGTTYALGNQQVQLKSGVTLKGVKGKTLLTSDQIVNLIQVTSGSGMGLKGIQFQTTKVDSSENFYGLVYTANSTINGLTIDACSFAAPSANVNGFKCVAEEVGVVVENVNIYNCVFRSIGRMGAEVQNHNGSVVAARYKDITIDKCVFDDIGRSGANGMGVSLSGLGSGCAVMRSRFNNCVHVGIELIGPQDTRCSLNYFSGTIGRIFQTANETTMHGITISENKTIGRVTGAAMFLASLSDAIVTGNKIKSTDALEIKSPGTKFTNNEIDTTSVYAVIVDNSPDCSVTDNTLRNTAGTGNWACLRLYGVGTTRTLVCLNRIHAAPGGSPIDEVSGSTGNVKKMNFSSSTNLDEII